MSHFSENENASFIFVTKYEYLELLESYFFHEIKSKIQKMRENNIKDPHESVRSFNI